MTTDTYSSKVPHGNEAVSEVFSVRLCKIFMIVKGWLWCEGHIVYFGPREGVMPFFNGMGFALPARKGIADFLQEVCAAAHHGSVPFL